MSSTFFIALGIVAILVIGAGIYGFITDKNID